MLLVHCLKCSKKKSKDSFRKCRRNSSGVSSWCKECLAQYNREWNRKKQKGKIKQCRGCEETKPIEDFVPNRLDRPGAWCSSCRADGRFSYNPATNQYENRNPKTDGTKRCSKCRLDKHVSEYWKCIRRIDGLANWCKECHRGIENTEEGRRRRKNHGTTRKYGVTLDHVEQLLSEQGNKCSICQDEFPPLKIVRSENGGNRCFGGFAIDHDHSSGKVRGLLCGRCNVMIGQARESVTVLQAAIDYLVKHSSSVGEEDE